LHEQQGKDEIETERRYKKRKKGEKKDKDFKREKEEMTIKKKAQVE
jgi:hypothetical protein